MVCKVLLVSEHFQAFIIIHKLQQAEVQTLLTEIDRKEGRLQKWVSGIGQIHIFSRGQCFIDTQMASNGKYYEMKLEEVPETQPFSPCFPAAATATPPCFSKDRLLPFSSWSSPSSYRHSSFHCTLPYCTSHILHFLEMGVLWQPCTEQVYQQLLTLSLCHILVILKIFQTFSLLLYLIW